MTTATLFKRLLVLSLDAFAILAGLTLAFLLRFDFTLNEEALWQLESTLPLQLSCYLLAYWRFRLYSGIWKYSSFHDLLRIIQASAAGCFLTTTLILFLHHGSYPRSVLLISPILTFLGIAGVRFTIRFSKDYLSESEHGGKTVSALIIGAGDMGESLLRQIRHTHGLTHEVIGFIDDDAHKKGMHIHDVPVLGGIADIPRILSARDVDEVIIAINTRRGDIVRMTADALRQAKSSALLKIAPALDEMLQKPGAPIQVRKARPADLLNREVVHLDDALIARFFSRKTVLVTGAGGTIGSELCRQALSYAPSRIILLDSHATSLFYCERSLKGAGKDTLVVPVLGSTLDRTLVERVFSEHHPHVVLHAAAHKHQPQLETNVHEAVQNNFLATYALAEAAHSHGSECFLLISTDKAVRPTSVMGATKRAAELAIQSHAARSRTRFLAVRFGNVLGSSGSVLKLFQDQIERGGPITLTHPDMQRYFMTVEEAVELILQACAMAKGGEIFILKMGDPVKILDMARSLILLNGLEPEKDIRIEYTGMRPGEKLSEELVESSEDVAESQHPRILRLREARVQAAATEKAFRELQAACQSEDSAQVLERLRRLVPSFKPNPARP